ncbi:MAG TPA: HAD hydrolase family protein, partial [Acholeplasma sp.]|nr:HAD hydrolase family protein [Acholeplasma sp.]
QGIKKALEHIKINDYKLFTIGDYLNDYEMLLKANVAFAPSNAHEKIKKVVQHVVKSHKEHAIFEMIQIINKL